MIKHKGEKKTAMKLYTDKRIQYGVTALYPIAAFGLLYFGEYL